MIFVRVNRTERCSHKLPFLYEHASELLAIWGPVVVVLYFHRSHHSSSSSTSLARVGPTVSLFYPRLQTPLPTTTTTTTTLHHPSPAPPPTRPLPPSPPPHPPPPPPPLPVSSPCLVSSGPLRARSFERQRVSTN